MVTLFNAKKDNVVMTSLKFTFIFSVKLHFQSNKNNYLRSILLKATQTHAAAKQDFISSNKNIYSTFPDIYDKTTRRQTQPFRILLSSSIVLKIRNVTKGIKFKL